LLASPSGLLVEEAGAEEFVGVVISMGSPGDGADIWIVGVRIGTVREGIGPSESSARGVLCALSVAVSICTGRGRTVSIGPRCRALDGFAKAGGAQHCDSTGDALETAGQSRWESQADALHCFSFDMKLCSVGRAKDPSLIGVRAVAPLCSRLCSSLLVPECRGWTRATRLLDPFVTGRSASQAYSSDSSVWRSRIPLLLGAELTSGVVSWIADWR